MERPACKMGVLYCVGLGNLFQDVTGYHAAFHRTLLMIVCAETTESADYYSTGPCNVFGLPSV